MFVNLACVTGAEGGVGKIGKKKGRAEGAPSPCFFSPDFPNLFMNLLRRLLLTFQPASVKAAKYEIQKSSTCRATLFRCKFLSMFPVFHLACAINLSRNKNIRCGLKKVVAKSRARVYFEQQILALLRVFHQTHNLSRNKFARAMANQPISALHFFNPQQMFLRDNLITPGEKRETSTKICNETMLRDKLRVFLSRISPPQVPDLSACSFECRRNVMP